jgi:prolyl 4-hydroxylase
MIGYFLAVIPLYIFIYVPLSRLLFGLSPSSSSLSHDGHELSFNESFIAFEDFNLACPEHAYTTHILSREPLVLYLEGFLSENEIEHLLEIRFVPIFTPLPPPHSRSPSIPSHHPPARPIS